jgi:hypothetical protein
MKVSSKTLAMKIRREAKAGTITKQRNSAETKVAKAQKKQPRRLKTTATEADDTKEKQLELAAFVWAPVGVVHQQLLV